MIIVFVHGIFDSGNIFNSMRKELENVGHECYAPDLIPADAKFGIADLAKKLAEFICQHLGKEKPIAIVGFSMIFLFKKNSNL
jgi:triacylglycerol lipase